MSDDLDELIKRALSGGDRDAPDETGITRLAGMFARRSRWVTALAWMKMAGTLLVALAAGAALLAVDGVRAQIALAVLSLVGFVGFAMWWTWYWMILNRNDTLRELKRLELQVADLRDSLARGRPA